MACVIILWYGTRNQLITYLTYMLVHWSAFCSAVYFVLVAASLNVFFLYYARCVQPKKESTFGLWHRPSTKLCDAKLSPSRQREDMSLCFLLRRCCFRGAAVRLTILLFYWLPCVFFESVDFYTFEQFYCLSMRLPYVYFDCFYFYICKLQFISWLSCRLIRQK